MVEVTIYFEKGTILLY